MPCLKSFPALNRLPRYTRQGQNPSGKRLQRSLRSGYITFSQRAQTKKNFSPCLRNARCLPSLNSYPIWTSCSVSSRKVFGLLTSRVSMASQSNSCWLFFWEIWSFNINNPNNTHRRKFYKEILKHKFFNDKKTILGLHFVFLNDL